MADHESLIAPPAQGYFSGLIFLTSMSRCDGTSHHAFDPIYIRLMFPFLLVVSAWLLGLFLAFIFLFLVFMLRVLDDLVI